MGIPGRFLHMAMGHNLWLHFGVDEHPFATYFDVHQGYRVLTHSHICKPGTLTPTNMAPDRGSLQEEHYLPNTLLQVHGMLVEGRVPPQANPPSQK